MIVMQQIHGDGVFRVDKSDDGKIIKNCDALVCDDPSVILSVQVADCLPISIVDKKSRSFGLIHAGWHGLQKQIITKTIKLMIREFHPDPVDVEVTIGPHICQKHYKVKGDVFKKFSMFSEAILSKDGEVFLDLAKVAEFQLVGLGVKKENIKIDKTCTFEDKNLFSFRRGDKDKRNIFYNSLQNDPGLK